MSAGSVSQWMYGRANRYPVGRIRREAWAVAAVLLDRDFGWRGRFRQTFLMVRAEARRALRVVRSRSK